MAVGDIGKRIREAREGMRPAPIKQIDLARLMNISNARLNNWEQGKSDPGFEFIEQIAMILNVTTDFLLTGQGPKYNKLKPAIVQRTGFRMIPVYGSISAGLPNGHEGSDVDYIEVKEWGGDFERWGRIIDGTSMEPDLIEGDIAVFENRKWEYGHVVHAYINGEDTIKYVAKMEGKLVLMPINEIYDPIDATGWAIKGVLVMRIRNEGRGITTTTEYSHGMRVRQ